MDIFIDTPRTTNGAEAFHSKFNASFYFSNPPIYVFIEVLKAIQIDLYVKRYQKSEKEKKLIYLMHMQIIKMANLQESIF